MKKFIEKLLPPLTIIGLIVALTYFTNIFKPTTFCAREVRTGWSGGSPLEPIIRYEVVSCEDFFN